MMKLKKLKVKTWQQLFDIAHESDIMNASDGRISRQLAYWWFKHGLPKNEENGLYDRCQYIIKAAEINGWIITRADILALNAEFKAAKKMSDGRSAKILARTSKT